VADTIANLRLKDAYECTRHAHQGCRVVGRGWSEQSLHHERFCMTSHRPWSTSCEQESRWRLTACRCPSTDERKLTQLQIEQHSAFEGAPTRRARRVCRAFREVAELASERDRMRSQWLREKDFIGRLRDSSVTWRSCGS
jgi:hypothetical protein